MTYIPGDYWMICERTGIKFRRSEMKPEPVLTQDGHLWVHEFVLNPPNPQDFVRVPAEDPSVYPAKPDNLQTIGDGTLVYTMPKFGTLAVVSSSLGFAQNDAVGIVMNNGLTFWSFAQTLYENAEPMFDANGDQIYAADGLLLVVSNNSRDSIVIGSPIHEAADAANVVYAPSINNEEWQT